MTSDTRAMEGWRFTSGKRIFQTRFGCPTMWRMAFNVGGTVLADTGPDGPEPLTATR